MEADNMGTVEWQRVVDLTQIMDRRNGKDRLAELIELARQEQKMLTVVFYDINGLHLINDTYGHHAVSYTHLDVYKRQSTPSNEYVLPCLTNIQQTTSDEGNFHGKLV